MLFGNRLSLRMFFASKLEINNICLKCNDVCILHVCISKKMRVCIKWIINQWSLNFEFSLNLSRAKLKSSKFCPYRVIAYVFVYLLILHRIIIMFLNILMEYLAKSLKIAVKFQVTLLSQVGNIILVWVQFYEVL